MGFTTSFTGGVTLTLGIAYITVLTHERHRQHQAQQLRTQSRVLTSLLEPSPIPPPQTRSELAHKERGTLIETAKDRWNEEVESALRWVQRTDWNDVRETLENSVSRLLNTEKGRKVRDEESLIASAARAKAQEVAASTREGAGKIADASKALPTRTSTLAKEKADISVVKAAELKDAAKTKARIVEEETKIGAHEVAESIRSSSGGTVDAARGAVRDAIGKGIEKGKETFGKAQAAVGLAEQKIATAAAIAPVEKALQERYEKPNGLEKSVEETLAARYKPVDAQDSSHLRGV
ncbi:hypothetical protein BJ878DRAFT_497699 [Calycina marina]|uniref:MICOS complex subunit MIC12 n=1 Tax=Calycina marina TaxID=1763456 RepID=A0A9P7Z7A6_9HELO|nr:hypothetical protein BJ878DRAFT_497699 [Calycina marina]